MAKHKIKRGTIKNGEVHWRSWKYPLYERLDANTWKPMKKKDITEGQEIKFSIMHLPNGVNRNRGTRSGKIVAVIIRDKVV